MDVKGKATGLVAVLVVVFGFAVSPAVSQTAQVEAPAATTPDTVTFGLDTKKVEATLAAIVSRQDTLESALRVFQRQLAELTEQSNTINDRLARGDEPLVSLDIEQLWAMVRTLESDNARLREDLDALKASGVKQ